MVSCDQDPDAERHAGLAGGHAWQDLTEKMLRQELAVSTGSEMIYQFNPGFFAKAPAAQTGFAGRGLNGNG